MNKEIIKSHLEKMDEVLDSIYDIAYFLNKICESDFTADCANHLYILTNLLNEKLEKIDDIEFELKKHCLN